MIQRTYADFWVHWIVEAGRQGRNPMDDHKQVLSFGLEEGWFRGQDKGFKTGFLILLVLLCWLLQKYYQDYLIAFLYSRFLMWKRGSPKIQPQDAQTNAMAI